MQLIYELLGCSLLEITRSFWAAKLNTGEWVSEARAVHDFRQGTQRYIDWYLDLAATGDCKRITELWLLCPPSQTSPLGNTARLPIMRPNSAFQFKIATHDSQIVGDGIRTLQAHVIGRVDDEEGNCTCFAYDPVEDGMVTPETTVYDPATQHIQVNDDGTPYHPMKTNVKRFGWYIKDGRQVQGMWRPSLAPLGQLALDRLGVVV
jgi:hypothetical protein